MVIYTYYLLTKFHHSNIIYSHDSRHVMPTTQQEEYNAATVTFEVTLDGTLPWITIQIFRNIYILHPSVKIAPSLAHSCNDHANSIIYISISVEY